MTSDNFLGIDQIVLPPLKLTYPQMGWLGSNPHSWSPPKFPSLSEHFAHPRLTPAGQVTNYLSSLLKMAKPSEAKNARQLIGLLTENIFLSLGPVLPVPGPSTVFVGLLRDAHWRQRGSKYILFQILRFFSTREICWILAQKTIEQEAP